VTEHDREALAGALEAIVRAAGEAVMAVYRGAVSVELKADASPLTEADLASHRVLVGGLAALAPTLPIVSEESGLPDFAERSRWPAYWLIDPLDGTKEFIAQNGEFTVNVALIDGGRPAFGAVGVPATGQIYFGDVPTGRAWCVGLEGRRDLRARAYVGGPPTVVASRRHGGERLAGALAALERQHGAVHTRNVGSALKLCLLADGEADLYPRLAPTSEWDIAAAQAVLEAAGGAVLQLNGEPLAYNKADILNPEFVAVADPRVDWLASFR